MEFRNDKNSYVEPVPKAVNIESSKNKTKSNIIPHEKMSMF